jgi:predicted dehydrogenase
MTAPGRARIGLIGCGNISGIYLRNAARLEGIEVVAVADVERERAEARAAEFDVPRVLGVQELLSSPDVDIVLDLTVPGAHADVNRAALEAGKHVYSEKPLATTKNAGEELLRTAEERGLRIGCAPDTFLGYGLQTARRLLDEGAVGSPVAAFAAFLGSGPERWHPNPDFFYQQGGGPLFDMGPYYLTALISLLGPIRRVSGSARITHATRTIGGEGRQGESIQVEVPTFVSATLDFVSGPVGTLLASFDVQADTLPFIEIYGTEGTLVVPDPNRFDGPLRLFTRDDGWQDIPPHDETPVNWRGLGLADMAEAISQGRPHRASGTMAFHVLDVMSAAHETSEREAAIHIASRCDRPLPLPDGPQRFERQDETSALV